MLHIENRTGDSLDEPALRRLVETALAVQGADPDGEVNLVLCGSDEMRGYNHRFRGLDRPTDVLSFECEVPETGELGDILIDTQTARKQMGNHSLDEEVQLLLLHGVLHLLGFDHQSRTQRMTMEQAQERCWNAFRQTSEVQQGRV